MTDRVYKITGILIVFIVFYFVSLYFVQGSILFYPDKNYVAPNNAGVPAFEEHPIVMPDGQMVMTWYAKGRSDKPAILFFHGNAGQIATFAPIMNLYNKDGYSVLMVEYRGYASTYGIRTEDSMLADAIWSFDHLKQKLGHDKIVVFGYSMGTGVASGLIQYRLVDGLILAAPFSSLQALVKDKPVPFATMVLKFNFRSDRAVHNASMPTLLVHGKLDRLIPPHHSEKLFDAIPAIDKTLELLAGQTHNSLYFDENNHMRILDWLDDRF